MAASILREVRRTTTAYGLTLRQWRAAVRSHRYLICDIQIRCLEPECHHVLGALLSLS